MKRPSWYKHPDVRSGDQLSRGEKAADRMKALLATWPAFFLVVGAMAAWIATRGGGVDSFPFILLNLALSAFAACQCFVLLISAKRGERIAYEVAMSTHQQVQELNRVVQELAKSMIAQDNALMGLSERLASMETRMRGRRGW